VEAEEEEEELETGFRVRNGASACRPVSLVESGREAVGSGLEAVDAAEAAELSRAGNAGVEVQAVGAALAAVEAADGVQADGAAGEVAD
jgi:hypothetical protein